MMSTSRGISSLLTLSSLLSSMCMTYGVLVFYEPAPANKVKNGTLWPLSKEYGLKSIDIGMPSTLLIP